MTISLPTLPVSVADVPEIANIDATKFVYNYFTVDECENGTGAPPPEALRRSVVVGDDGSVRDNVARRMPRYVEIKFTPPVISSAASDRPIEKGYIAKNIAKVISETHFSAGRYIGVNFEIPDMSRRMYDHVSGSATSRLLDDAPSPKGDISTVVSDTTSELVPLTFLSRIVSRQENANVRSSTKLRLQFDARIAKDAVKSTLFNPQSLYSADIAPLVESLASLKRKAVAEAKNTLFNASDFDTAIPFVSIEKSSDTTLPGVLFTRIVGFIIDRYEVSIDGTVVSTTQFVIDNPRANRYLDFAVKYGTKYAYAVRTVAEIKLSVISETDDGKSSVAIATALVASKQSVKTHVSTVELIPPPPPADLGFVWDYTDSGKFSVLWSFPVNTQRDIVKFQIFRRKSITDPFELIAVYDFSSSKSTKFPDPECDQLGSFVTKVQSPVTNFVDQEFTKDSSFIYAVASVDAHGMSSGYSQQVRVSFDRFKNKITKTFISKSGAPKPYPNFFLNVDAFSDTVNTLGKTRARISFTPDALTLVNKDGTKVDAVQTNKTRGHYIIQMINRDLQKQETCRVYIDDRRFASIVKSTGDFLSDIAATGK